MPPPLPPVSTRFGLTDLALAAGVVPDREHAWLARSMSNMLVGNLTVLGPLANLIVVEYARRAGTEHSVVESLEVGVPLTVITTLVGVAWLSLTPSLRKGCSCLK